MKNEKLEEATAMALMGKLNEAKNLVESTYNSSQGICPKCGKPIFEYGDINWDDDGISQEFECSNPKCNASGREYYNTTYDFTEVDDETLDEARSHKEDNEKASPRGLPADYVDAFDDDKKKAYYGKGLTKRDKIRSEDQAKRNAEKDDDRQTGRNVNISGSYEKTAFNPDVETFKFRKDMAKIHRGEEPTYNKDLTVNGKSKLEPTDANLKVAKDWDKSAQEIVDKHKKSEAKLVEDEYTDNLKSAIGDANTLDDVKEWVDDIERRVEELETAYNTMYADILDAVDDLFSDNTPRGCLTGLSNAIRDVKEELENIKFD